MIKVALWSALGFMVGVVAGVAFGQSAKSKIGEAINTDVAGGVLTVTVDGKKILAGGLSGLHL